MSDAVQALGDSFGALLRVDVANTDAAKDAWNAFQRHWNQASAHKDEVNAYFADIPQKKEFLEWAVAFQASARLLRGRVSSVLTTLLEIDSWRSAAKNDADLAAQLKQVDEKVAAALDATPAAAPPPAAVAQDSPPPAGDKAPPSAPAAPAAQKYTEPPSAGSAAPIPTDEAAAVLDADAAGGGAPKISDFNPFQGTGAGSEGFQPPPRSSSKEEELMKEAQKERKIDEETLKQLKKALAAIKELDYNPENKGDRAIDVLNELGKAVNKVHAAHERQQNHVAPSTEGDETPATSMQTLSFTQEDLFGDCLNNAEAPKQVIMFLFQLQRQKQLQRKRCSDCAHKLVQLSSTFSAAVRSDAFLLSWLGGAPPTGTQASGMKARTITYALASRIHWAAWDRAWYAVHKQRRKDAKAQETLRAYETAKKEVLKSVELPEEDLKRLMEAAEEACMHAAETRFPEAGKERGIVGNVMGAMGLVEDKGPHKDKFMEIFTKLEENEAAEKQLIADLMWMMWNLAWYAANYTKGMGHGSDATKSLVRAARHYGACYRGDVKWRGVNLGGWFLLEPGPCTDFWRSLPEKAQAAACEYGCCEGLGKEAAEKLLTEHRRKYFSKEEFQKMRAAGFTHVRLPFGAWCVVGPRPGEQYVGPCLAELDKALEDLEAAGLMVILDLHGPVGGISEGAPSGHKNSAWRTSHWDEKASLEVLRIVAERYSSKHCICGFEVANEPSESLSVSRLADYYEKAVKTVRTAGMAGGDVTVILPIFTERRRGDFIARWEQNYRMYEDCAFDLHLYQCFGLTWKGYRPDGHIKEAQKRKEILEELPACLVGEWSLAATGLEKLGGSELTDFFRKFADKQLQVYDDSATHGWFFWTWKDSAGTAWCLRDCLEKGIFKVPGA
mmetsp:Transcript_72002/g.134607  ORF Transcript_72002/g.134607 Transcript_72002/m.134607 type:complete len:896 (+) Transcript_72002:75-2762(+)